MIVGMVAALGAAVCFGVASVLQAKGARAAEPGSGSGVDTRLLARALAQRVYLAGLALDAAGFGCELVALRRLPIYAVGAALAASLAVTAVAAVRLLGAALNRTERAAVGTVCGGLALLGLAAAGEGHGHGGAALRWGTLAAAGAVLLVGAAAGRLPGRARAAGLGLGAGLGFGVVEVAVRLVDGVTSPALYALLLGGGAAFLLLTSALSRGSVTTATAAMVVGETVGPALVGVAALGDRTRAGWAPVAVAGFALAVLGALVLARFGEGGAEPDAADGGDADGGDADTGGSDGRGADAGGAGAGGAAPDPGAADRPGTDRPPADRPGPADPAGAPGGGAVRRAGRATGGR